MCYWPISSLSTPTFASHAPRDADPAEPRWPYLRAGGFCRRDRDAGLLALRRAAERSDDDANGTAIRLRLAETLLSVGTDEEAGGLFRHVLDKYPTNVRGTLRHGYGRFSPGRLENGRCRPVALHRQPVHSKKGLLRVGGPRSASRRCGGR